MGNQLNNTQTRRQTADCRCNKTAELEQTASQAIVHWHVCQPCGAERGGCNLNVHRGEADFILAVPTNCPKGLMRFEAGNVSERVFYAWLKT